MMRIKKQKVISHAKAIDFYNPETSAILKTLWAELETLRSENTGENRLKYQILNHLYLLSNGKTKLKKELRKYLRENILPEKRITHDILKKAYEELRQSLNKKYRLCEASRTHCERSFQKTFEKHCKRRLYHTTWIGNCAVDFFLPSYRHSKGTGVAYEIDGGIHNNAIKGLKDENKDIYLGKLGILFKHYENHQINDAVVLREIQDINERPIPHCRTARKLWARIYLETLTLKAEDQFLKKHFGLTTTHYIEILKIILTHKGAIIL